MTKANRLRFVPALVMAFVRGDPVVANCVFKGPVELMDVPRKKNAVTFINNIFRG